MPRSFNVIVHSVVTCVDVSCVVLLNPPESAALLFFLMEKERERPRMELDKEVVKEALRELLNEMPGLRESIAAGPSRSSGTPEVESSAERGGSAPPERSGKRVETM